MEGPTGEVPLATRETLSSLIGGGLAIRFAPSLQLIYEVKVTLARWLPARLAVRVNYCNVLGTM